MRNFNIGDIVKFSGDDENYSVPVNRFGKLFMVLGMSVYKGNDNKNYILVQCGPIAQKINYFPINIFIEDLELVQRSM